MTIETLDKHVVAMMAAGEIIHRPSDILKELLENALDAQASQITVNLMQGGKEKIQVTDNGSGIKKDYLEQALTAHATSKLRTLDDLQKVQTFGFRGEALHSIAHVCNFSLISKTKEQELAYQISLTGQNTKPVIEPCAHGIGTTIKAFQLFAPYPVRRKFLKSPRLELGRSLATIRALALAFPEVGFICDHNNKRELTYQKALSPTERYTQVFPQTREKWHYQEKLFDKGVLKLWYCPQGTKGVEQWWFINKRAIQDQGFKKLATHLCSVGKFIIHIDLEPSDVDPNLHPQKMIVGLSFYEGLLATIQDFFQEHQHLFVQHEESLAQDFEQGQSTERRLQAQATVFQNPIQISPRTSTDQNFQAQLDSFQSSKPTTKSTNISPSLTPQLATSSQMDLFKRAQEDSPTILEGTQDLSFKPDTNKNSGHDLSSKLPETSELSLSSEQRLKALPLSESTLAISDQGKLLIIDSQKLYSTYLKKRGKVKPLLLPFAIENDKLREILSEHQCLFRSHLMTHAPTQMANGHLEQYLHELDRKNDIKIQWSLLLEPYVLSKCSHQSILDFIQKEKISHFSQEIDLERLTSP